MSFSELWRRMRDQTLHKKLRKWEISLKNIANVRDTTNMLVRRVKSMWIRLAKKHVQISINKLRDRKQIIPQLIYKSDIIQGEEVIYLDDVGTEHFTFHDIPKNHILFVW
jgi:hypothetical protein